MWSGRFEVVTRKPIEYKRRELEALCERRGVECLALFGSALRDDFDPEKSDLDFPVTFCPMRLERHAAAYLGLRRSIEEEQETLYAAA